MHEQEKGEQTYSFSHVRTSNGQVISMVNGRLSLDESSLASTVNLNLLPFVVSAGSPLMIPLSLSMLKPSGSSPAATFHVTFPVAPEVLSSCWYSVPEEPAGSLEVVILRPFRVAVGPTTFSSSLERTLSKARSETPNNRAIPSGMGS